MTLRRLFLLTALACAAPAQAQVAAQPQPEVPVLVRDVGKGELLDVSDFGFEPRPLAQGRGAIGPDAAAGKEAARALRAGAPVRSTDLIRPQLVRRGEPVALTVRSGGLLITAQGKALSGGAKGDLVRVLNTATSRTLDGVVEKAGSVRIAAQ